MTDTTKIAYTVRQTIATALGRTLDPYEEVRQIEEPSWDSLKHVEIMLMLEEAFGIVLNPDDFVLMTSVEACVTQVTARLEGQAWET